MVSFTYSYFKTCSFLSHFKYVIYYVLAEPTKKVKLTMIPMSNNWSFGKEDVDELLFMLQVNCNFSMIKFKITILFLFLINTLTLFRMHQILFVDLLEYVQCLLLVLVVSL